MNEQNRLEAGWLLFIVGLAFLVPAVFLVTEPLGLPLWKHFAISLAAPVGLFLFLLGAKYA
jgi:hypothetical protein